RVGPADVALLNQMQALHALQCIYFAPDRMTDPVLQGLLEARKRARSVYELDTLKSAMLQHPDGTVRQIVGVHGGELRLGAKLSFIRLMDQRRYYGYDRAFVVPRSPELLALAEDYGDSLNEIVEQQRPPPGESDACDEVPPR